MKRGKIYLIPTIIAAKTEHMMITPQAREILPTLQHFLVEDARTARRYLSRLKIFEAIEPLSFDVLDKDTDRRSLPALLAPALSGIPMGILSESGCPGVADPGAMAVHFAHEHNIPVVPLVGPSSILLALMASGLNGQRFAFQGYLPIAATEAAKSIHAFEKESSQKGQTQIFIETPYRTNALFQLLTKTLRDSTLLCLALDITGESEEIRTLPVRQWKTLKKVLPKAPAVFLFLANPGP
jgi:16S rRNA (cytidine1402-2'-O)-methyltransferase